MNKQEFSKKIVSWGSWCTDVHDGKKDRYVKISKVQEFIEELDEPQKVKVPKCVGELLDYYRNSTDVDLLALLITFKDWYFRKDKLSENEEAIDWLVRHPEKFMKAWLDGYEVEEEPKYRVNIGGLYLKEPLADTNDFTISMTWNKDYAYPFDSWNMAREHTSELGGTVEKV
ncbi:DUF1642 domain-containing protein [Enterococcus avium]|uniref:DUF1642 domain-containing protein n=1 Tax=Enterococcus avium TaxID=33945 RepID=UPI002890128F|nr:DUF1642 domain-containing protein [Enterococcus avium]MDT2468422.1 DUF1642 domain-containing protein [Enterococcus avium]MDT2507834.1 DUF1642 domain-containing protein [Enterococcus avium]